MASNVESKLDYEVTSEEATAALIQAAQEHNAADPENAVAIEWETLANGIATNDPVVLGIIAMANHHSLDNEGGQEENAAAVAGFHAMDEASQSNEILGHASNFTQAFTNAYNEANGTEWVANTNVKFGDEKIPAPHDPTGQTMTYPIVNDTDWTHHVDESLDVSNIPSENLIYEPGATTTKTEATYYTESYTEQVAHTTYEQVAVYTEEKSSKLTESLIPFVREVTLKYKIAGLKRDSAFSVYTDKINISEYVTPSTELNVTVNSGIFDTKSAGTSSTERSIPNNPVAPLLNGDIITGSVSGATAILIGIEKTTGGNHVLYVSNVKNGPFLVTDTLSGSESGASASLNSINTPTSIKSTPYGNLFGLITLPNNGDKKFTVGSKELIFTTTSLSDLFAESFAVLNFTSTGTFISTQPIITINKSYTSHAVTTYSNVEKTRQVRGEDKVITMEGEPVLVGVNYASQWKCPVDPLCQTFFVEDETGIFVTGVDLYFAQRDENIPLYVSIVDTVNGYPGPNAYSGSETFINGSDVILSSDPKITIEDRDYSPPVPTRITFRAPVYLRGGKEYGIYIKSDSEKYYLWTSYMGNEDVSGSGVIQSQPLLGSLFKSQSASAWTTDQYEDLTFKLYRAEFDVSNAASVPLINEPLQSYNISSTFGKTKTGSSKIRLHLHNNGLSNGDTIRIEGLSTGTYGGAMTANDINGDHIVSNVEYDFCVIDTGVSATSDEYIKQDHGLKVTKNIKADIIKPAFKDFIPTESSIDYSYKKSGGTFSKLGNRLNKTVDSTLSITNVAEMADPKTLEFSATMSSSDARISPVLSIDGIDAIGIANRINRPSLADIKTDLDTNSFTGVLTPSSINIISTTDTTTIEEFENINIGMVVTIAGIDYVVHDTSIGTSLATITLDKNLTVSGSTLIEYNTRFRDEIAPSSSKSISKYVSRPLKFANPSTGFKLFFTYNQPHDTSIDFYYKVSNSMESASSHKKLKYNKIENLNAKSTSALGAWTEGTATITDLNEYDMISVKIVFNSIDSTKTPRLKDFRIVAVA